MSCCGSSFVSRNDAFAWFQATASANQIRGNNTAAAISVVDPEVQANAVNLAVTVSVAPISENTLTLSEAYKSGTNTVGYRYAYITGDNTTRIYKDSHTLPDNTTAAKVYAVSMAAAAQEGLTDAQVVAAIKAKNVKLTVSVAAGDATTIAQSRVRVWASATLPTEGNTDGYEIADNALANVENREIADPLTLTNWDGSSSVVGWFTVQVDGNKTDSESQTKDEILALPTITASISEH